MKSIAVEKAVGLVLGHDITEIVPGSHKRAAFKRGHVVRPEDVPHLLKLGKENLYVWSDQPGQVHEDEAAERIVRAVAGPNVSFGRPAEGRINLTADIHGLFVLDVDLLAALNDIPDVSVAAIHTLREVQAGQALAGARVIPLCAPEESLLGVESLCRERGPLMSVKPFLPHRVGVVTTGGEVYHGRIEDGFTPVLRKKFAAWGSDVIFHAIVPDAPEAAVTAITQALDQGADLVAVTGGMSVDPDDKTPAAIRRVSGEVVIYGTPVFPGAMFMLGYQGRTPILGLPGCVMYSRATIFDLIAPRLLAGQRLTRRDFTSLGHGGFCEQCQECHFPNCGFGR